MIKMNELITNSEESASAIRLGYAVGAYKMLKELEPALSDGLRHGSSECGAYMGQLSKVKGQLETEIQESLNDLGIPVTLALS